MSATRALLAIRMALMSGVLLFGAVAWFVQRSPDWTAASIDSLVIVGRVMWLGVVSGLTFLWFRSRAVNEAGPAATLAIIAWSLGEMLALFGGVLYFQSGLTSWYVAGVLALAIALVAFPGTPAS